ncbi:hypothetical protein AK812_SmicGene31375 [Symbiodinium microadriaticum]|uniref:Uncharacterized protein n=1 Tax=Symbiodinium microadriaticum TaxID=2951 RepID=A0A1Q9CWX3_SYMMI|nr:hypothetical protein AK812_SmicGene31375 [Symbiodinium microadriaticum]
METRRVARLCHCRRPTRLSVMTETWQQSYLYPGPLLVRNTFIDDPLGRDCLTEGFLHERQAFSCPVSRISEPGSGVEVFEADKAVPEAPPEDAESSDCSTSCTDGLQTLPPAAPTAQTVPPPDVSDFSLPKFGVRLSELPLPSEGAQHTNGTPSEFYEPLPPAMSADSSARSAQREGTNEGDKGGFAEGRGSQLGEADSRALCCHAIILCRTIDQLRDLQLWVLPREIGGHRCGGERGTAAPPASARPDPYARKEEEERE